MKICPILPFLGRPTAHLPEIIVRRQFSTSPHFPKSYTTLFPDLPYSEVEENPNLAMVITKTGGHIGFLEVQISSNLLSSNNHVIVIGFKLF